MGSTDKSSQDALNRDPFLTLISVIESIIGEGDKVSATQGLNILEKRVNGLLKTTDEDEFEKGSPVDESLKHLSEIQIPQLLEKSLDVELTQTATDVTEVAENIGETSIEVGLENPLEHILKGQTDLIDEVGHEPEQERVRNDIIDVCRSLLSSAVENGLLASSAIGTRLLGWIGAASIMERNGSENYDSRYTTLLINGFPKILRRAINTELDLTDYPTTAWMDRNHEDVESIDLLIWACYDSMAELTSAGIRYEMRTEQNLLNWTHLAHGWTSGFDDLSETELESLPKIWLGTILYLEYISEETGDEIMNGFDPQATFRTNNDYVVDTIRSIRSGEIDPTSRINHIPGGTNPLEKPRTGIRTPPVRDTESTFDQWLGRKEQIFSNLDDATITSGFGEVDDLEISPADGNDDSSNTNSIDDAEADTPDSEDENDGN